MREQNVWREICVLQFDLVCADAWYVDMFQATLSVGFLVGSIAIGYMADKYNWHLPRGFPILRLFSNNYNNFLIAFWISNLFYFIINKLQIYFILKKSFGESPLLCTLSKFIFFYFSAIKIYTHCLGEQKRPLSKTLKNLTDIKLLNSFVHSISQPTKWKPVMVFISMHKRNVLNSDLTDSHLFLFFLSDTAEWRAS